MAHNRTVCSRMSVSFTERLILRYITDLPTDLSKFEIEEDRQIYQELRSVCTFSTEFEELKLVIFLFLLFIKNRFDSFILENY